MGLLGCVLKKKDISPNNNKRDRLGTVVWESRTCKFRSVCDEALDALLTRSRFVPVGQPEKSVETDKTSTCELLATLALVTRSGECRRQRQKQHDPNSCPTWTHSRLPTELHIYLRVGKLLSALRLSQGLGETR